MEQNPKDKAAPPDQLALLGEVLETAFGDIEDRLPVPIIQLMLELSRDPLPKRAGVAELTPRHAHSNCTTR